MKKRQSKSLLFKSKKKLFFGAIVIVLIGYLLLIVFSAFKTGTSNIDKAGLQISTNVPSTIFVDNQKIGDSAKDTPLIYSKIDPGARSILIKSNIDDSLTYNKVILFEKGTQTVIDWNFGPTQDTSSGIIEYFIHKTQDNGKIRVITTQDGVNIKIDGQNAKNNEIVSDGKSHTVLASKNGYLNKSTTVTLPIASNKDGIEYENLDLVIEITLFQIPFS